MKKVGIIIVIFNLILTLLSVVGIMTANAGRQEGRKTLTQQQFDALMEISKMEFPEGEEDLQYEPLKNYADDLDVRNKAKKLSKPRKEPLEGLTKSLVGPLAEREEVLIVAADVYLDMKGRIGQPLDEMNKNLIITEDNLEELMVRIMASFDVYRDVMELSFWDKICLFSMVYRSVFLIVGFLGMGLGLAIATSGAPKSDLDG